MNKRKLRNKMNAQENQKTYSLQLIEKALLLENVGKHNSQNVINALKQQVNDEFTLDEIKYVLERENIGRFQTQYVMKRIIQEEQIHEQIKPQYVEALIQGKIQQKPYYGGVQVNPFSRNNVNFTHKGQNYELHFMENGNLGFSKQGNNKTFIEISSSYFFDHLLSKL